VLKLTYDKLESSENTKKFPAFERNREGRERKEARWSDWNGERRGPETTFVQDSPRTV